MHSDRRKRSAQNWWSAFTTTLRSPDTKVHRSSRKRSGKLSIRISFELTRLISATHRPHPGCFDDQLKIQTTPITFFYRQINIDRATTTSRLKWECDNASHESRLSRVKTGPDLSRATLINEKFRLSPYQQWCRQPEKNSDWISMYIDSLLCITRLGTRWSRASSGSTKLSKMRHTSPPSRRSTSTTAISVCMEVSETRQSALSATRVNNHIDCSLLFIPHTTTIIVEFRWHHNVSRWRGLLSHRERRKTLQVSWRDQSF